MLYALPLLDNIQTTIEMHRHGDAIWHFDHNKHPACHLCFEQHVTNHACAYMHFNCTLCVACYRKCKEQYVTSNWVVLQCNEEPLLYLGSSSFTKLHDFIVYIPYELWYMRIVSRYQQYLMQHLKYFGKNDCILWASPYLKKQKKQRVSTLSENVQVYIGAQWNTTAGTMISLKGTF